MVIDRSERSCLLCNKQFVGRTFLCRECSDRYRGQDVPFEIRQRFYQELDFEYPDRSNTYDVYNRPEALLEAIMRLPRHVAILEVGAGGGFLLQELHNAGFSDLTGSDITESAVLEMSRRIPEADLVLADAARLSFQPETFDIVISSDVVEHLPDVEEHFESVATILKPRGLYFIKTPNRLVAEAYYRLRGLHDSYFWHPWMFTAPELSGALERYGFEMRMLRPSRLTEAQMVKLPGGKLLRPIADRLPVEYIPAAVRPHLEVVARKSAS
ncbi:MAG: class I SAM-dependent methyltransferase [Thermomicrobiales bacterium]